MKLRRVSRGLEVSAALKSTGVFCAAAVPDPKVKQHTSGSHTIGDVKVPPSDSTARRNEQLTIGLSPAARTGEPLSECDARGLGQRGKNSDDLHRA
jgi:hypothetical protein